MTRQVYLDELDKLHKKVIEMGNIDRGFPGSGGGSPL